MASSVPNVVDLVWKNERDIDRAFKLIVLSKFTFTTIFAIILNCLCLIYFPFVWLNTIFPFLNSDYGFVIEDVPFYDVSVPFWYRWVYAPERYMLFWWLLLTDVLILSYFWIPYVLLVFELVLGQGKSLIRWFLVLYSAILTILHAIKAIYGFWGLGWCNWVNPCRNYLNPNNTYLPNYTWGFFVVFQILFTLAFGVRSSLMYRKQEQTDIMTINNLTDGLNKKKPQQPPPAATPPKFRSILSNTKFE